MDTKKQVSKKNFGSPVSISNTQAIFLNHINGSPEIILSDIQNDNLIETSKYPITIQGENVTTFAGGEFSKKFFATSTKTVRSTQKASGCPPRLDYINRLQHFIYIIDIENKEVNLLKESRVQIDLDGWPYDIDDQALSFIGLPNGNLIVFLETESHLGLVNYKHYYFMLYWDLQTQKQLWSLGGEGDHIFYSTYRKYPTPLASEKLAWLSSYEVSQLKPGIHIWDLKARKYEKTLTIKNIDRVSQLLGLTSEKLAVCTRHDFGGDALEIWDVNQSQCTKRIDLDGRPEGVKLLNSNCFAVITQTNDFPAKKMVSIWETTTCNLLKKIELPNQLNFQDMLPDGRLLCIGHNSEPVIFGDSFLNQKFSVLNNTSNQVAQSPGPQIEPAWRKRFDGANANYAAGKGAFYTKDFSNAIKFFQLAKDDYKEALTSHTMDAIPKQKAQNRIDKIKEPGKYSISHCK